MEESLKITIEGESATFALDKTEEAANWIAERLRSVGALAPVTLEQVCPEHGSYRETIYTMLEGLPNPEDRLAEFGEQIVEDFLSPFGGLGILIIAI